MVLRTPWLDTTVTVPRCTFYPHLAIPGTICGQPAVCTVDTVMLVPYPRCAKCLGMMLESWTKSEGLPGAMKFAQRVRDLNGNPVDIAEVLGSNTLPFTED